MQTSFQQNQTFSVDIFHIDDLQEWIGAFLHACRSRNLAVGTIEFYAKKLRAFAQFCQDLAITRVDEVTPHTIRQFLIFLEERQHKPAGVHCYYRSVKTFLNWYEQETERTDWRNPINKVKAPTVPLEPLDPVSVDTIKAMIQTGGHTNFIDARDKALLLALLDTGARVGELLSMNKQDLNLISGVIQIRSGKGRKPRNVYLGNTARRSLRRYLRERTDSNAALWINQFGERMTPTAVRSMLRRRAVLAGVPIPSPHDFRRAFALERWRGGADVLTISKLMGHESLQVLSRYLKQAGEDLEQAARKTSPVDLNF